MVGESRYACRQVMVWCGSGVVRHRQLAASQPDKPRCHREGPNDWIQALAIPYHSKPSQASSLTWELEEDEGAKETKRREEKKGEGVPEKKGGGRKIYHTHTHTHTHSWTKRNDNPS